MEIKDNILIKITENDIENGHITIPNNVTEIGPYVFKNNLNLTSITLPEGLTKINEGAFCHCDMLKTINFPSSLLEIDSYAFIGCGSLTQIHLNENLQNIKEGAFCGCFSLKDITIPKTTKIENEAFLYCTILEINGFDTSLKMEDTLSKIETFFDLDIQIKESLYSKSPNPNMTEEELIKYSDELWKLIGNIEKKLISICALFHLGTPSIKAIQTGMNNYREILAKTDYTYKDLQNIYNNCFARMSEKNLKTMHDTFIGDTFLSTFDLMNLLNQSSSINETLHIIHEYITNNDNILKTIKPIKSHLIEESHNIVVSLRGDENEEATQIYNALIKDEETLPEEYKNWIGIGNTEIISINKSQKILIMVREKGHCLTIEAAKTPNHEWTVEYFIPKPISYQITSKLKGINNYHENDTFAVGSFAANEEVFVNDIVNLINSVPTDAHLIYPGKETMPPTVSQYLQTQNQKAR